MLVVGLVEIIGEGVMPISRRHFPYYSSSTILSAPTSFYPFSVCPADVFQDVYAIPILAGIYVSFAMQFVDAAFTILYGFND